MKIFSIRNKKNIYGYLFMNEKLDDCYIELKEGLEEYPIFFNSFVEKNKYTINSYWTFKWINERIIPYERQNINTILKENNIPYYNELLLLMASKSKSSMDDNYIELIKYNNIDEYTLSRMNKHIIDFIYAKNKLFVFFKNNTKVIQIKQNSNQPFLSPFGNEIIFDNKHRYDYLEIYNNGVEIPLLYEDLIDYVNENVLSSREITEEYGFSRQYLNKLKQSNQISVLSNGLYIKNNIKLSGK